MATDKPKQNKQHLHFISCGCVAVCLDDNGNIVKSDKKHHIRDLFKQR